MFYQRLYRFQGKTCTQGSACTIVAHPLSLIVPYSHGSVGGGCGVSGILAMQFVLLRVQHMCTHIYGTHSGTY